MARKFLTSLDLNQNELIKAVVQNSSSDPGSGRAGQIYYNTVDDVLKIYSGTASAWVAVGSTEYISDAVAALLDAGDGIYLNYNDPSDSLTITNTGVLSLTGTASEVEVSASAGNITLSLPSTINADTSGNAATATALQNSRTISLGGDLSGSASFNGTTDITISATVQPNSVALGTDTTGDYVAGATAGSGIDITGSGGEGSSLTISNTGVLSVAGTTDEITVSASAGNVTISLPSTINADTTGNAATADNADSADTVKTVSAGDLNAEHYVTFVNSHNGSATSESVYTDDAIYYNPGLNKLTTGHIQALGNVDVDGDLIVDGNLTVSGSTTYLNTATLQVEDNLVVLNSNVTGSPTTDAGIEVERGDQPNSSLYWDESEGKWTASNGSAAFAISLAGHTHTSSDITNFSEAVEDAVDSLVIDTDTVGFVYTDNGASAGTLAANVLLAGAASATFLTTTGGLSVDKATLETALVADSFTKKYSVTIGDGSNTAYAITHNLGTRDCVVNVYDISTYETVEVDVVRTNTTTVTVTFASAPSSNSYRVVVIG